MAKNSFNSISLTDNVLSVNGAGYVLDAISTPTVSTNNSSFVGIGCTDNGNGTCTLVVNGQEVTVNGSEQVPSGYTVNIGFRNNLKSTTYCQWTRAYSNYTINNDNLYVNSSDLVAYTTSYMSYPYTITIPGNKLILISKSMDATEVAGTVTVINGTVTSIQTGSGLEPFGFMTLYIDNVADAGSLSYLIYDFTINSNADIAIDGADWRD